MTGFTACVFLYPNRVSLKEAFEAPEPDDGKLSRPVLRGPGPSNGVRLLDPHVLCCFLRSSLTEIPSLHRRYPASLVLRASPPPHTARPDSHELPVDRQGDHRWGFPCCYWSTLPACRRHYPGRSDGTCSLVLSHQRRPAHNTRGGMAPALHVSRPAQRSLTLRPADSPSRLSDPLHRRLRRFVSSTAAPIASGWSEPSSRAGLSPAVVQRLFTAHVQSGCYASHSFCEPPTSQHSLTWLACGPTISANDRPDHLALPHPRKARRGWDGNSLQSRRYTTATLRRSQVSPRRG